MFCAQVAGLDENELVGKYIGEASNFENLFLQVIRAVNERQGEPFDEETVRGEMAEEAK